MANIKISQLPAKGANLGAQDLVEVAEFTGTGYVSKSITGQEIIDAASGGGAAWGSITGTLSTQTDLQTALDAKQDDLVSGTNIKTINGSSVLGSGDLVVGGNTPTVIVLNASNGTAVTGTTADTLSQSILIPANTFTSNGMLEVLGRIFKTGTAGGQSFRIYKNTSASLTGATLIATITSGVASLMQQGIRTYRINSNVMSGINTSSALSSDYGTSTQFTTTFNTSVDNYILFSIQLANAADSSVVEMSRTIKYV